MFKSHIVRAAIETFFVAIIAYVAGYNFSSIFHVGTAEVGGLWSVISGVFVMTEGELLTFKSAKLRVRASFVGCLIAALYLYFFTFGVIGFAISVAIGVYLCHVLNIPDHVKTTSITISVVVIISALVSDIGPIENASLRFVESIIGSLSAVLVAVVSIYVLKLEKKK
ncbi:MAG: FUSC family protein [Thermodesulfobacteriota bacterium]